VGNQLVVKNGYKLDYEQATSHQVTVRVTDQPVRLSTRPSRSASMMWWAK